MLPDVIYHYVAHQGETVMKYDLTLWENQAIAIQRIERICQLSHLSLIGVRERIWHIFSINVERMFDLGMSSNNICRHLSKAREMTFYSDFFKAPFVSKDHSVRANIGYVLMKNKLFLLFLLWKRIGVYYKKKG